MNPADLYIQYFDEATITRHSNKLAYHFVGGRAAEAPKLHFVQYLAYDTCIDVPALSQAMNCNNSLSKYVRQKVVMGGSCMNMVVEKPGNDRVVANELTGSGQQVLQGTNWQVQGYNGLNAAQLVQPWGSTPTFQRKVGVSWAFGLRHGVAMHPRGRHLREGMALLFTWESRTEREQQPRRQHVYHDHWEKVRRNCCRRNYYNYYYQEGDAKSDGKRQVEIGKDKECIVLTVQGASQRSSQVFPRTRGKTWPTVK